MKNVLSLNILAKSRDKTEIVTDLFNISVDKYSSVLFQRFDHGCREIKDKANLAIIQKKPNIKDNHDYGQAILLF